MSERSVSKTPYVTFWLPGCCRSHDAYYDRLSDITCGTTQLTGHRFMGMACCRAMAPGNVFGLMLDAGISKVLAPKIGVDTSACSAVFLGQPFYVAAAGLITAIIRDNLRVVTQGSNAVYFCFGQSEEMGLYLITSRFSATPIIQSCSAFCVRPCWRVAGTVLCRRRHQRFVSLPSTALSIYVWRLPCALSTPFALAFVPRWRVVFCCFRARPAYRGNPPPPTRLPPSLWLCPLTLALNGCWGAGTSSP